MFNVSYSVADFVFKIGKYNASFLLFPVLNVIILYLGVLYGVFKILSEQSYVLMTLTC